jgi:hypothetical protein
MLGPPYPFRVSDVWPRSRKTTKTELLFFASSVFVATQGKLSCFITKNGGHEEDIDLEP